MPKCLCRPAALAGIAAAVLITLAGCATTQRPVLYPNATYRQAGEAAAQRDIDACMRLAEQSGVAHGGGERVARRGAEGAAVGGATGAVAGAVHGGNVGDRAAAGAAVGATAGAVHGAMRSAEPAAVYKGFVQRCLRERGYDVIGWQ
jgi:outer membrane lipoprotein SlyB